MPCAKATLAITLTTLALSACGSVKVQPTSPTSRGRVDDPRTTKNDHVSCLRAAGLSVQELSGTDLQVAGTIRVHFEPTPGAAQFDQISDREQAAEVIGSALVYPGTAPDAQLATVERCIAQGVKG